VAGSNPASGGANGLAYSADRWSASTNRPAISVDLAKSARNVVALMLLRRSNVCADVRRVGICFVMVDFVRVVGAALIARATLPKTKNL